MPATYRKLLSPSQLRARREELVRLEVLAEQLLARIDVLRAELADTPENPNWSEEITPVTPSRWRR